MSSNPYANLDEYGLRHMAGHLYKLGAIYYSKLYQLATAQEWHAVQRRFDPSRQSYAESLDWALRAAEMDPGCLPVLLVASLLRATVSSLAANVPPSALQVLSLLGRFQRAQAYTALQADALLQCESLCNLAITAWESGDTQGAQRTLERAGALTHTIADPRPRVHALGLVASTARQMGPQSLTNQTFQAIQVILARSTWPIAVAVREYHLLDQPDYILSLVEWDRVNGSSLAGEEYYAKTNTLAIIVRIACQQGDWARLNPILAEAKRKPNAFSLAGEPLLEALIEGGCGDAAFQLLAEWSVHPHAGEVVDYRKAIARAAGSRGDLAAIERAASFTPPTERERANVVRDPRTFRLRKASAQGATDKFCALTTKPKPEKRAAVAQDWDEHLEDWKDRLGETFNKVVKRAGGSLLGADWDKLMVLLAGLESLVENHPEQAQELWARLTMPGNADGIHRSFTRRGMQEYLALISAFSGETPPKYLSRYLDAVGKLKLATLVPDSTERDETLSGLAVAKASMGKLSQALEHVSKIENPVERDTALADMAVFALHNRQTDQALEMAAQINQPNRRKNTLDDVAQFLLSLPPEQVEAPLQRIFALADQLPLQEMFATRTTPSALFGSLAETHSANAAYSAAKELVISPDMETLTVLCRLACIQADLNTAHELMAEIEKQSIEDPSQASSSGQAPDENPRIRRSTQLAEVSVQCVQAADRARDAAQANAWLALSERAFRFARDQVDKLSRLEQPWGWPYLARAARYRRDRDALQELLKQISRQKKQPIRSQERLDRALVHIAVGLTLIGDYLEPGKAQYPPAVEAIHWHHFKAQALAEMSEAVRAAPPKKGLLGFGRDKEFLEMRADSLLKQSKQLLGLQMATLNALLRSSPFKPTTGISPLTTQPRMPPKSSLITQVPTREALGVIIAIYARRGLYHEAAQIPQQIASDADRPAVFGMAVKALAEAGQTDQAQNLMNSAQSQSEKAFGAFSLASVQALSEPNRAKQLMDQAFPTLWELPEQESALLACAEALLAMPAPERFVWSQKLLRVARTRGRSVTLNVLTAHVKVFASLVDPERWLETIKCLLETETWWVPSKP